MHSYRLTRRNLQLLLARRGWISGYRDDIRYEFNRSDGTLTFAGSTSEGTAIAAATSSRLAYQRRPELRQLGKVDRHAPRLVAGQPIGRRAARRSDMSGIGREAEARVLLQPGGVRKESRSSSGWSMATGSRPL